MRPFVPITVIVVASLYAVLYVLDTLCVCACVVSCVCTYRFEAFCYDFCIFFSVILAEKYIVYDDMIRNASSNNTRKAAWNKREREKKVKVGILCLAYGKLFRYSKNSKKNFFFAKKNCLKRK